MKPQDLFSQIIDVDECHEYEAALCMFDGTTVVELPNIPIGTKVMVSFNNELGICQLDAIDYSTKTIDDEEPDKIITLGKFAMKLTLEPITE